MTYTPRLRSGVVLCGTGTAGAYQAGALRALSEAGVKIDVVAAHGAGALNALALAIDGGSRLWGPNGPWTSARLRRAYRWRPALRLGAVGLLAAVLLLLSPLLLLVAAAAAYALGTIAALLSLTTVSARLIDAYARAVAILFDPPILPTIVPRLLVLVVLVLAGILAASAIRAAVGERSRRRRRGAFWWLLLGAPLDASEPSGGLLDVLWNLVRGASDAPPATAADLGRRYVDVVADNFGQPGFHELLIAVHDIDSRRDLVGGVLAAAARAGFEAPRPSDAPREAETVDLTGPARTLIAGFLQGALRLPVVNPPAVVEFPHESYWRGERHRLCDRPELVVRLVEELAAVGVEQVIFVSPAPPAGRPHALRALPADGRGRIGELVRSLETAALQDGASVAGSRFSGVFVIRPDYNPIGPFEFGGTADEASDRRFTVEDLVQQGYADAYRQFIEPMVAAGERLEEV